MSRELLSWIVQTCRDDTLLSSLLGTMDNGMPAVFSYHYRATPTTSWPRLTVARFSSSMRSGAFDQSDFAHLLDDPRIAICAWSRNSIDEAYHIYKRADELFRGPSINVSNAYFGAYRVKRTHYRDDLFDQQATAYHIHGEYQCWLQLTGTPQPF